MNISKEICVEEERSLSDLPDIVLEKIFLYMSYDEIAKKRQVCQRFNRICGQLLTSGFLKAEKYHSRCMKSIKAQLPRRESERRNHPLSKHCDILSGIETRMSMLSMTFMKFISNGMCCFIPGKVIDEIFRVLRYMQSYGTDAPPPRTLETLQELRDISSMAMEHFEEKIVPILKSRQECQNYPNYPLAGPSRRIENFQRQFMTIRNHEKYNLDTLAKMDERVIDEICRVLRYMEIYGIDAPTQRILETFQELRDLSSVAMEHIEENIMPILNSRQQCRNNPNYPLAGPSRRLENFQRRFMSIRNHEKCNVDVLGKMAERLKKNKIRIAKQARMLQEQNAKLLAQDAQINELKQHLEEWDHKLRELEAKVNRVNDENALLLEHSEETVISKDSGCKRKCVTVCSEEDKLLVKKPKVVSTVENVGE